MLCHNRIRDDRNLARVEIGSQGGILFPMLEEASEKFSDRTKGPDSMMKDLPSMADADDMVNITECETKQLVRQDTCSICKSKQ